jgi:hypothetical protein
MHCTFTFVKSVNWYAISFEKNKIYENSWCIFFLYVIVSEEEKKRQAEANSPLFVVKLKDTELLENTYLRFMIKVQGDPNPTLTLLVSHFICSYLFSKYI